jgi:CelD/BcsL family acetyltransferase involved in cellulose biosynthesis
VLTGIPASGPFWDILRDASPRFAVLDQWERAALRPTGDFTGWFEGNFDRKRRKEFRRLRARLGEQGRLESAALQPGDDVPPWVNALLDLEAAGWKGKRGTALKQDQALARAFTEAAAALHAEGRLRFWSLKLDGKTIATLFAIVEGDRAWLGKIAYDEAYAKFSPGVLLILDATEAFFAARGITLVDSCAIPGHPMIDRIWRDRIAIADVMVAAASTGISKFALVTVAEKLRRNTRSMVRDLYYKITRRHRS